MINSKITKKIICGNWKMNPLTTKEAEKLFKDVVKDIGTLKKTEIVIFPPFLYLKKLKKISKKIALGAQDAYAGDVGAYTGEISTDMLYDIGARYVILGHSERRKLGESDGDINKKLRGALASGLVPVLCVGELTRDEEHNYFNFIKSQLEEDLSGVSKNLVGKIIIAYEPIWAISTTPGHKDATALDAREMVIFIRKVLFDKFSRAGADVRIIYGGSVNEKNAQDFLQNAGVDGLLPGGVSLNPKKFTEIIKICEALHK